jgi:hypothetical protein
MKALNNKLIKFLLYIIPSILAAIFLILFVKTNSELNHSRDEYKNSVEKFDKEKKELIFELTSVSSILN